MQQASFTGLRRPPALSSGFTAIELMVVVAIVAILATMAAPSFSGIIERYRIRRASEDLTAAIYLARTEAMRRGGRVAIQKMSSTDCPAANNWSCGWVVFADANGNGVLNPGEEEIQVSPAPTGVRVTAGFGSPQDRVRVDRWGRLVGLGALNFRFTPVTAGDENQTRTRILCLASGGRLQSKQGVDRC
jgi:type IV fimbrial biogenesis protein FimT